MPTEPARSVSGHSPTQQPQAQLYTERPQRTFISVAAVDAAFTAGETAAVAAPFAEEAASFTVSSAALKMGETSSSSIGASDATASMVLVRGPADPGTGGQGLLPLSRLGSNIHRDAASGRVAGPAYCLHGQAGCAAPGCPAGRRVRLGPRQRQSDCGPTESSRWQPECLQVSPGKGSGRPVPVAPADSKKGSASLGAGGRLGHPPRTRRTPRTSHITAACHAHSHIQMHRLAHLGSAILLRLTRCGSPHPLLPPTSTASSRAPTRAPLRTPQDPRPRPRTRSHVGPCPRNTRAVAREAARPGLRTDTTPPHAERVVRLVLPLGRLRRLPPCPRGPAQEAGARERCRRYCVTQRTPGARPCPTCATASCGGRPESARRDSEAMPASARAALASNSGLAPGGQLARPPAMRSSRTWQRGARR
jgi:hypothetical protein